MRILVIEDDKETAALLTRALEAKDHAVGYAADGDAGLQMARSGQYDVLIVDRMLPKRDGLSVIRLLRSEGRDIPALVLSAMGEVDDRIEGLRSGGDDYLTKPYSFGELLARLEALSRRIQATSPQELLQVADLKLDLISHKVHRAGQLIRLQPKELQLLEYLMRHAGQLVTRTMLLEQIWNLHFDPETNVIDAQVSRLRGKVDKGFDHALLKTIRGQGYCLSATD